MRAGWWVVVEWSGGCGLVSRLVQKHWFCAYWKRWWRPLVQREEIHSEACCCFDRLLYGTTSSTTALLHVPRHCIRSLCSFRLQSKHSSWFSRGEIVGVAVLIHSSSCTFARGRYPLVRVKGEECLQTWRQKVPTLYKLEEWWRIVSSPETAAVKILFA